MIKNIFLDLDDTLFDFHKAEAIALSKTLSKVGIEPIQSTLDLYSAINATQWELLEEGKITREQVLTRRFEILFEKLGFTSSSYEAQKTYENLLGIGHYFIPGAKELIEQLAPKYNLYIVSNGTAKVQDSRLASSGIVPYFKDIFISQRIGYDKPNPKFFDYCFAAIPNFRKEETIIVGDSLTSDMKGGILSGITTCWFNPKGKPSRDDIPVDYQIESLDELLTLLEKINK